MNLIPELEKVLGLEVFKHMSDDDCMSTTIRKLKV